LTLPPAGHRLIYLSSKVDPNTIPVKPREIWSIVPPSTAMQIMRTEPNVFKLDYCTVRIADTTWNGIYAPTASDLIFKQFGFQDGNPWNTAVQYHTSILDRNRFPSDSGFEADFPFLVDPQWNPSSLQAVVERPNLWKVSVNGKPASPNPGQWFIDRDFAVFNIGSMTVPGNNTLTLKASPMSVHNELEPIILRGDFGVANQPKGWKLIPPANLSLGPWKEQFLPFYGSSVSYSADFPFDTKDKRYLLALTKWNGVMAEVRLDGKSVGQISWTPYTFELTPHLKGGTQKLEVLVYGSLKNLYGPHHQQPASGMVSPGKFLVAPKVQPAGSEYDLLPYGMFESFQVGIFQPAQNPIIPEATRVRKK
jgi:hypothetical protein